MAFTRQSNDNKSYFKFKCLPPNDSVGLVLAVVDAVVVEVSNPPSRGLEAEEVAGLPRVSPPSDK